MCLLFAIVAFAGPQLPKKVQQKAQQLLHLSGTADFSVAQLPEECGTAVEAYNVVGGNGYVIMAEAENGEQVIVGYSTEGNINPNDMPEAMRYMLSHISVVTAADGEDVVCRSMPKASAAEVAPLLGNIAWGQDYPFNLACPTKKNGTHYYVGCVATAATQIMRYHQWPLSYDWANMPEIAPEMATSDVENAYSLLAADFGKAVNMEYLDAGSAASSMMVPKALRDNGYQSGVRVHRRNYYSSSEWTALLRSELSASRPVFYGASSDNAQSGHAFVCDGYDQAGYFHINWGWYGNSNGYFLLNHFDPSSLGIGGGAGGYNRDQEIVTGITKDEITPGEWPLYGSSRLSVNNYGNEATFMVILENFETIEFSGRIAVVVMRGTEVLKVLHSEDLTVGGFNGSVAGYKMLTMRNVPLSAVDAADGDCQLRFAFSQNGSDWTPLRHDIGFPSYVAGTIANKQLSIESAAHAPQPDVAITALPVLNGPAIVGGALSTSITLQNKSADYRLKNIVIRLTSKDGTAHYDMENEVSIYDESLESITLTTVLPNDIQAGEYDMTFFEKGFESLPFDDSQAGRLSITINENPGHAVFRATQESLWASKSGIDAICQGDGISFATEVRNYGPKGTMAMQLWLQDVDDNTREYIYHQQNVTAESGKKTTATFYRNMPLDPGKYQLVYKYVDAEGNVDTEESGQVVEIAAAPTTLPLAVESIDMPTEMVIGQKYACSVTLRAVDSNYSGTVYVRLRQFTNSGGEIATMGSQSIAAGQTKTINFSYKPGVAANKYFVLIDYKKGTQTDLVPAGYANYYQICNIITPEAAGIEQIQTEVPNPKAENIYNIFGQRVSENHKGIVIQHGKKILRK